MTYKKHKEQQITGEDIQIDSSNLLEKKEVYLNQKYTQDLQHLATCINGFDWHTQTYICQLCSHENCSKFMGFVEAKEDDELKVYCSNKFAWVLENEDGSMLKAGDCITTSNIRGLMKVTKEAKTNLRIGVDVEDQDNVLLQQITGHDRLGLLYQPILNEEEGNPVFERLPKVRYFNLDGSSSEEFKYVQSLKKSTIIKDIKTKKLDMDTVDKVKRDEEDRLARLTRNTKSVSYSRPTHPLLARKDSGTSFLVRKSSRDVLTSRSSVSSSKKEEAGPIKRTVVKAYLVPIF